jgi:amino acid adenylation domain
MKNVLEYLEHSSKQYPDKIVVRDEKNSCSYKELLQNAQCIGSALADLESDRKPVIVFMEKSVEALTAFMGIVYAGCFYISISPELPIARIRQILAVTGTNLIIALDNSDEKLSEVDFAGQLVNYKELINHVKSEQKLQDIRNLAQDIDPLYCNFTSGSTGIPKGVLVSHRSVIDFMEYFPALFHISETDIIGNQAPFDFDVSVKDIYSTLKVGATMVIIPKKYFSIPMQLLDYLCEHKITTLIWAVSALCLITQLKGFTYKVPTDVNKILFSGEMMPVKHLNIWRTYLPDAHYVNLYGPTEITCNCTYYPIEREFATDEKIPIGKAFPNEKVFLLDENDQEITDANQHGELCVSGTALALGYYNNEEQTQKSFVQNPLNSHYIELIYRTGDYAFYDADGNLCFAGRKDFQIKHMGHRIELEEIELVLNSYPEIQRACCIFDSNSNRITAYYVGNMEVKQIQCKMLESLPAFMIPNSFCSMSELPLTNNGKIDRKKLLSMSGGKSHERI